MKKTLFILKKRSNNYQSDLPSMTGTLSSGLINSVKFVDNMLNDHGIESHFVEVDDNNDIDREVTKYKPDVVIIEAIWVVPNKFEVLRKRHPNVQWIIRIHSEIPFISGEGNALEWLFGYVAYDNVLIAANTERMEHDLKHMLAASHGDALIENKVIYLPNYYKEKIIHQDADRKIAYKDFLNVGCFGAIRPLKNQLIQAMAAIEYARENSRRLRFHINGSRIEQGGNVLKNIRNLFANLDNKFYELVEHPWLNHEDFLQLVSHMDVGLQVSFSETFNIVTADFVSRDVPVVVSSEITWLSSISHANTTSIPSIAKAIKYSLDNRKAVTVSNKAKLREFNHDSERSWIKYLG
jgi:hypothetical protein